MVRMPGLRPGAERQPLRVVFLADGEHFLERVEQVRPLFNQRAPRGPHGRPVAGRVLPEHVAERRHVLLVQRAVEGGVHGVRVGRALGVDVEHDPAVEAVGVGQTLDALQSGVQRAGLGGAGVNADAHQWVLTHAAKDITVVLVGVWFVIPDAIGVFARLEHGQRNGLHDSKLLSVLNSILIVPESTGKINSFSPKILPYFCFCGILGVFRCGRGTAAPRFAYRKKEFLCWKIIKVHCAQGSAPIVPA